MPFVHEGISSRRDKNDGHDYSKHSSRQEGSRQTLKRKFDENAILAGQKFANKLWNIARFVMMQNPKTSPSLKLRAASDADKKILEKLNKIIKSTDEDLDQFRFGQAAHDLYDFVWHDFADVYIEESKKHPPAGGDDNTKTILLFTLTQSLKLLHPYMPFITEEIWQVLFGQKLVKDKLLINAEWPKVNL